MLLQATVEEDADKLQVASFRLARALNEMQDISTRLDRKLQPLLGDQISAFRDLTTAVDGLPQTQEQEIAVVEEARALIEENEGLAVQLTTTVDSLVDDAKAGIADARAQARSAQAFSTNLLYSIVALALVSSVLIVWLYVGRKIVQRLVALSRSMMSIAEGRLDSPIPDGGNDEISRMAEALSVFRATAIEVQESNLREIREARRRLNDAIESISEGFALFDADDRLVVCNSRYHELYPGLSHVLVEGAQFKDILAAAADQGLIALEEGTRDAWLRDRLAKHNSPGPPFLQRQADGRWIQISERETGDGGFVAVYTDVTELKQQELAVQQAKEKAEVALEDLKKAQTNLVHSEKLALLGQLAAGIAHEIKNPLNFVRNFSEVSAELVDELAEILSGYEAALSKDDRGKLDELSELLTSNLEKIVEHSDRADAIVKGMLAHSRGVEGDTRVVGVNALVEESLNLAYHGARATDASFNVTLDKQFSTEAGDIEAIPQDLSRVFLNLFNNAFYATQTRQHATKDADYAPTVSVSTRDLGDTVQIKIRDNGNGMPDQVKSKVFTPFFTTKPAGEGTGLGLSLSFDIVVHKHHGSIEVASEPNNFTEFTIELPRHITQEAERLSA